MEMTDEYEAMELELEDDSHEFTFAEIIKLEKLHRENRKKPIDEQFCRDISAKFNCSDYRSEKPLIKWAQVQTWFQDRQMNLAPKVSSPSKEIVGSKAAVLRKQFKVRTISASEAAVQLPNLMFEAQSAKDFAWFDVASFLSYKVLCSGELLVRVRFSGFGKEEDEWVSVRRAVRERSIPLDPYECDKVEIGDSVLCFREGLDHALYCDARIVEIERKVHDSSDCTCVFVIRYDHDNSEGKVTLNKLCCRPRKSVSNGSDNSKPVSLEPTGMQKMMQLLKAEN